MSWQANFGWLLAQAGDAVQAAQGAPAAAAPDGDEMSTTIKLLVALGIIVGSFVLGGALARALRMPDYAFKLGVVVFALVAGLAINYFGWPPKRGIDLSGGVVLVYEVDTGRSTSNWMESAISRINERLNAEGGERLEARPVGENEIEIVVPQGVDVADVEQKIEALRGADLALNIETRRPGEGGGTVLVYRADATEDRAFDMSKLIAAVNRRINPAGVLELTIRQYGAEQLEVIIPNVDEREVEQIKEKISTSGLLEFRIVANPTDDKDIIKAAQRTSGRDVYIGGKKVGQWVKAGDELPQTLPPPEATYRQAPDGTLEILARIDPFNVDGRYLTRAAPGYDERMSLAVDFSFNAAGAERFRQLTQRNLPDQATDFYRHLGIILDNRMISAPRIISTIGGQGQISGRFTQDYVDVLVGVLNAGSLPASLRPEPISQQRISSQLGDDTIRAGANAMIISTAAILVFMLVYYRFAGIVADLAVTLNVVITVALMILIQAAFTLPGLAGLVLTVGMAVDANVLIYERMREESARGASLRMAIRNGFARATGTIIDSNLTTLITAVVLYIIGTDQIKGFAVTLILGLLVSMFTAIYVSRVIFDIAERKRWLTQLRMMKIVGETHFDFIRWRGPAIAVSLLIIIAGLVAATMRGKELLDIDFTGGSSVQVAFAEGKQQDIAAVRKAVAGLPDVAVSSVGDRGLEFKIDTSDNDIAHVKSVLQKTFGDALKTYSMTYGELALIEPPAEEAGGASKPAEQPQPKLETQPADEAKPAAEEKPADKPAEQPESKPAAAPEAPAKEPAADQAPKSSWFRRADRRAVEVAAAGNEAALVALLQEQPQEQSPAKSEPAGGATEQAAPQKPVAEKPSEEKPTEEKAAEEKAAEPSDKPAEAAAGAENKADAGDNQVDLSETRPDAAEGSLVGGTRVVLSFPEEIAHDPLRELVEVELDKLGLKEAVFRLTNPEYQAGSEMRYKEWTLEISLKPEQARPVLEAVQKTLAETPVFPSSSEIGGKVAGDTQLMALYAMVASMVMIVIYVWVRFQNLVFGIASVLALLHDVLVTIAFLALSAFLSPYMEALLIDPFKISLPVVAALLTIVGFSINDTIVIFDRIREVRGKSPELTEEMINVSVNQTLSRTLLTSGTVFIASIILYIVGGPGIHAFAFAMVVGVIAGTYSSVYIAAPVLLWLRKPAAKTAQPSPVGTAATAGGRN